MRLGMGTALAEINYGERRLMTFSFEVQVACDQTFDTLTPKSYINWQQWLKQELNAYVDKVKQNGEFLGGTMAGQINLNDRNLFGLAFPVENDHAANREYVDQKINNWHLKIFWIIRISEIL